MELLAKVPQESMVKWRRHLHENPELSFKEFETTDYIESILASFPNIRYERLAETGVIATLEGSKPGKTVALRADIDALPVKELADVDYPSKVDGVMHACGHDAHTAMLLGAVEVLSGMQDKIAGKVKFIFQAAEEVPPGGAKQLVELGVLDDVDMIFGIHVAPKVPVGVAAVVPGAITAASDRLKLIIKGKGAHGSMPQLSIDPIMIGSEIVSNFNNIVSRNVSPFDNAVISMGKFQSGEVANIIPHTAELEATIRTNNNEVRALVKERIIAIVENVCSMYGAEYEYEYIEGYSPVRNNAETTKLAQTAVAKVIGEQRLIFPKPIMGGEDFSAYTDVIPGTFYMIGCGTDAEGCGFINHHPKFKINEECLRFGAASHVQTILDILGE